MLTAADMSALRADANDNADHRDHGVDGNHSRPGDSAGRAESVVSFEWLNADVFAFPAHMSTEQRAAVPAAIRGYGMGYRHMCRTFSGPLFRHPSLSPYEYIWRLDSDSFLLAAPLSDPFADMQDSNASYAWIHAFRDEQVFVTGLWERTKKFLEAKGIDERKIHAWVPDGKQWNDTPMCFATNCFLARLSWFRSESYTSYFDALDETGGFYAYRWGDACVHMLAAAALLPKSEVLSLRSLAYWHQGTVILPAPLRAEADRQGLVKASDWTSRMVTDSMFAREPIAPSRRTN